MSKKIGRFRILIACLTEAFSAVRTVIESATAQNEAMEEGGALPMVENPVEMDDAAKVDMLISGMGGTLPKGTVLSQESARLKANELLMSSKTFVLLTVKDNGSIDAFVEIGKATAADLSALLILIDQAGDSVQGVLYPESMNGEGD